MFFPIRFIIFILFCAVVAALQVWLSEKENKYLGLVLPLITFIITLLFPLNMLGTGTLMADLFRVMLVWLIANIPTIILLIIYYICRGKQRKNKQLDKMKILDLN